MAPDVALAALTVVVGDEELLVDREVARVLGAARVADPDAELAEITAGNAGLGDLAGLLTPSLFGERRVVVVRAAQDLPKDVAAEVLGFLADPIDEVSLVVLHAGGAKGKAFLQALVDGGARRVDCARVTRPGERMDFVRHEVRQAGREITEDGLRALLDAVGSDLRELATAVGQLLADNPGPIDGAVVARYHRGRAEVSGFAVADRAVEGQAAAALEQLRWALATGVHPLVVNSALAAGLRGIARVAGAPRGARPADLARELGMPPWKIDRVRQQARGWRPEGVAAAVQAVAAADAEIKGGGEDPAYSLERAVRAVVDARAAGAAR